MTVLQICAFGAPSPGNFISSLTSLEPTLSEEGIQTIYAFAETAKGRPWCEELCKRAKVYFLPVSHARILPKTYQIVRQIYQENQIDIVHSHFELYDIPATAMAPKNTKVFWHLHQNMQSMQQSWDLTVSISTMFLMGSTPHESRLLSANQSLTTS